MDLQKTPPRVTISRSEKVNTGNYTSQDIFVSMSIDLDDDLLAAINGLNKMAPALVSSLLAEVARQKATIISTIAATAAQPTARFETGTKPTKKWGS